MPDVPPSVNSSQVALRTMFCDTTTATAHSAVRAAVVQNRNGRMSPRVSSSIGAAACPITPLAAMPSGLQTGEGIAASGGNRASRLLLLSLVAAHMAEAPHARHGAARRGAGKVHQRA